MKEREEGREKSLSVRAEGLVCVYMHTSFKKFKSYMNGKLHVDRVDKVEAAAQSPKPR